PITLACLGHEGDVPTDVPPKANKYIEFKTDQVFDEGWARFDRGSDACTGGRVYTVFLLCRGASLRNAIIGKNEKVGMCSF
ncbi:hypothetical protein LZ31DRAFT_476534, partial [Colletotrichum somersetense]